MKPFKNKETVNVKVPVLYKELIMQLIRLVDEDPSLSKLLGSLVEYGTEKLNAEPPTKKVKSLNKGGVPPEEFRFKKKSVDVVSQ